MISPRPSKTPNMSARHYRKILPGILLCALLSVSLGGIGQVRARQAGDVTLRAQIGFDGFCKEQEWLPIHVQVENTGPDLNAEVQVSYNNDTGGASTASMNVELASGSRKEFFLDTNFAWAFNRRVTVALLVDGQVLKKVNANANCLAGENLLVGVLADTSSAYDVLVDVKPLNGLVRLAQLEIVDLPDRAQAWGALDALILSNIDTGAFTPEQTQALHSWIAAGGKLLVIGGTNWQGTVAGIKDLMPIDLTATRRVASLTQLQDYVKDPVPLDFEAILGTGTVREEAQVLLFQDGVPLIVRKQVGFGTVYYFAADPALQPLRNWSGMRQVYEHLLGSKTPLPTWADGTWYDYRANQALATIPELGLPSIFYICGVLGLYIAVIGPLNYLVLRRLKRRELAWVTIPVLVILFTCLAYGTGFSYRGVTPILNRLAIAQAWDGVDQAQVHALVGLYSPVRTKYDLEAGSGFLFQPFSSGDMSLQAGDSWATLQQGSGMLLPGVSAEIGDMKAVAVEGSLPALQLDHDLVLTISKMNPMLSGNITNKSQYPLEDAILVTPGNWTRLGDLAAGETKPVSLSLATNSNGPAFYNLDAMTILNLNYTDIQTDEIAARRNAFLETVFFTDFGMNQGNWGIYLMGWIDQIELPAGLKDQNFKAIDTMLYIDSLSPALKTEPGELRLPTSLFTWESSLPTASAYHARDLSAGGYTLRLRSVVPISPGTVKSIDLSLTSNAAFQDLVVSAWDYELRAWTRIPVNSGHTNLPAADRYVGPDGEIMLKIASNRSDWTEITASNISVLVEP